MITKDIIKEVYEEVKRRCYLPSNIHGIGAWHHHIELVYKLAISNYKDYNANYEIVALSSLLHDIASITSKDFVEEHHIIGAKMAEDILNKYMPEQLSDEEINKVIDEAFAKINPTSPQDMGKIIGSISPMLKGKADMGMVSKLVKDKLSNL